MAKNKDEKKVDLERTYNVPLRKEFQKAPKYRRAKKAVNALKAFLERHMKSENIRLGRYCNEAIWNKGIKNPPHHIKVNATKYKDGSVFAELVGAKPKKEDKKAAKAEKPAAKAKAEEKKAAEEKEAKPEGKKEDKPATETKAATEEKKE